MRIATSLAAVTSRWSWGPSSARYVTVLPKPSTWLRPKVGSGTAVTSDESTSWWGSDRGVSRAMVWPDATGVSYEYVVRCVTR